MNRYTDTNYPLMRYECTQCGMMIFRNDFQFKEFLLDIFDHTFKCGQRAEEAGVPVERERGN